MFLLNNKPLQPGVAFIHDGIQYPANFLNLSSPEEKEALGIVEVAEQIRPDDRYYWVTDNQDGTYTTTPKTLDDETNEWGIVTKGLKSNKISEIKTIAGSLLSQTDWMITRKMERSIDIPEAVVTYRAAVVTKVNDLESSILACTTVEDLIAIDYSFPVSE